MLLRSLFCLGTLLSASALEIKGKMSITTKDDTVNSYALKDAPPSTALDGTTWKMIFAVQDEVLLRQAHLLFEGDDEDVRLPVQVKKGKGSFTINPAKPHPSLLSGSSSGKYAVTLLLSTLDDALSQSLGSVTLPSSSLKPALRKRHDLPPRAGEPAFQPQPEIFHTFQPEPKQVGIVKSAIGVALVVVPWFILAILHTQVAPKYNGLSGFSALFLLTLAALETLIFVYWLRLKLYHFLPAFLPLSLVAAYTGKLALSRK